MKVKILNNLEYITYPITDDMIEIDDSLIEQIGITKQFDVINNKVIPYNSLYKNKIIELKNKLSSTDYQAIKYAEGQLNETEYAPIKIQRQEWRDEINKLEEELNNGNI